MNVVHYPRFFFRRGYVTKSSSIAVSAGDPRARAVVLPCSSKSMAEPSTRRGRGAYVERENVRLGSRAERDSRVVRVRHGARRKSAPRTCSTLSIGNPSVPRPCREAGGARAHGRGAQRFARLHAGSDDPRVRRAVIRRADELSRCTSRQCRRRLGSISAVTEPGDEVIIIAPFFPEYKVDGSAPRDARAWRCRRMLDIDALANTSGRRRPPSSSTRRNNLVGAVYSRENLEAPRCLPARKKELGRKLYVISDEPYREITYGAEVPYVPCVWPRTIVCYSYSSRCRCGRAHRVSVRVRPDGRRASVHGGGRRGPRAGLHLRAGAVPARYRALHR